MTKTITVSGSAVTLKTDSDAAGEVTAVIATLNVIDRQGDVILPKAIGEQQVRMSAYGHGSWPELGGQWPVGKGRVYEKGEEAVFEGRMFMGLKHAADTFNLVREMGDMQEWSFSLQDVVGEKGRKDDREVQFIKGVSVRECCPVWAGAGIATRTLTAKSNDPDLQREIVRLTADVDAKAADIERLNAELKQERNATARGLFQVAAL